MNNASAHTELVALEERVVSTGNELSKLVTSIYEYKLEIKRYNALVNNDLSTALIVDRNMDVSRYVNPTVPAVLETVVGAGFARLNRMKEEKKHLDDFYETSRNDLLQACEAWDRFIEANGVLDGHTSSEEFKRAYESRNMIHNF